MKNALNLSAALVLTLTFSIVPQGTFAQQPEQAKQPELTRPPAEAAASASTARRQAHREDWSTPVLDEKTLQPMSYAAMGTKTQANFTRELIRVEWRKADPIDLIVILPHGVMRPQVILYLYGFPSDTNHFYDDEWCKRATRDGFAAVGFVSALTGDRDGHRAMKEWFVSELNESLSSSAHDVQMVINYLARRGDLETTHVGMFGQGSGGTIAILAASVDPRIRAVDVLDPWGDWPDWYKTSPEVPDSERPDYLKPEFLKGVSTLDPVLYLPRLGPDRLRMEISNSDQITPSAAKDKLGASVADASVVVRYQDEREHLKAYRANGGLAGWIEQKLRPAAPCPEPADAAHPCAPAKASAAQ